MTSTQQPWLESNLIRILRERGVDCQSDYRSLLGAYDSNHPEWRALASSIAAHETRFFRAPRAIQQIQEYASVYDRPLRIWSAGCSYGHEPYSVALALAEVNNYRHGIIGSDFSQKCIEIAQTGVYPIEQLSQLGAIHNPDQHIQQISETSFAFTDRIKDLMVFRCENIMEFLSTAYQPNYDIIICLNLMIYYKPQIREALARSLAKALVKGGVLIVGPLELRGYVPPGMDRIENRHLSVLVAQ